MTDEQSQDSAGPSEGGSLRDDLRAALEATTEPVQPEVTAPEPEPEDEPEVVEASDDGETEAVEEPAHEDEEDAPEALSAPENWTAEDREAFSRLDREGQEFLLRRHKELETGFHEKNAEYVELRKAIEPYAPYLQQLNATPEQAVPYLLGTFFQLRANPEQGLRNLAQQLGVNLSPPSQAEESSDDYVDPQVAELKRELAELKQAQQGFQTQQQTVQQQELLSQVSEFANAKDDAGNPQHPHFEKVRAHMGSLIKDGLASGLDDAYAQAVNLLPEYRESLLEQERKKLEAQLKEESKKRAEKAKRAAPKVKGGSVVNGSTKPKSVKQELAEKLSEAGWN